MRLDEIIEEAYYLAWLDATLSSAARKAFRRLKYAIRKAMRTLRDKVLHSPEYHRVLARIMDLHRRIASVVGTA